MKTNKALLVFFAMTIAATVQAQRQHNITVRVNEPGAEVQSTMYGLFFEDINYASDGGLYAEMVKNRSFEFPNRLMGWTSFGNVTVMDDGPFERNPHYVRLASPNHNSKSTGIENEGFFGIAVKAGGEYRFTVWARGEGQKLRVELVKTNNDDNYQAFTSGEIEISSDEWQQYELILKSPLEEPKARLRIFLASAGTADIEHVSLFPLDTWNGRRNGLRRDLVQALYDIQPGVLRFPGGCIIEGTDKATRYQWKNTVGPVENRPLNENRWQYTFTNRLFPDYFQSGGLGFYEFFLLAEDIGAEALPILNCGLVCQFQNSDDEQIDESELGEYVQDALDLVEFANGDASTKWGGLRAEMGHPEPFDLKYIGIGNEQWGEIYPRRLKLFVDALRERYPEIKIVGSAGPSSDDEQFHYLWSKMTELNVDLTDEHFYRSENWFLSQAERYDNYDRSRPKVFAGEYACHGEGKAWNHFNAALSEAAFMTGLERNADVVSMATYAPLFAHIDGWQWRPDMIWFDNMRMVCTCSYYVQQLFSTNKGTNVLPLTLEGATLSGQDGLYGSAVWDYNLSECIVKIVNTNDEAQAISIVFEGLKANETLGQGTLTTLHSDNPNSENTLDNPMAIVPCKNAASIEGDALTALIGAKTLAVYKFKKIRGKH